MEIKVVVFEIHFLTIKYRFCVNMNQRDTVVLSYYRAHTTKATNIQKEMFLYQFSGQGNLQLVISIETQRRVFTNNKLF